MKQKLTVLFYIAFVFLIACNTSVEYSETFKKETSGKYLYHADDVIEINYDNNDLYFTWRGVKTQPVVTDTNEFFVPDLYQKLQFVKHPETNQRYLAVISEDDPEELSYDYIKVSDDYKTPSEYIEAKEFNKALEGLLALKAQDSTSDFVNEYKFNRIGYKYLRNNNYDDAIGIFTMNTKLHPNSGNVYDSLADAYARKGDSLTAYENYKRALSIDKYNERAKRFITAYEAK